MSGTIVVGVSGTPGDSSSYLGHAFAYDLAAAHPHMVDLGTLGGRFSGANAVDGTWVVGGADSTDGTSHAFAYNLAATRPHMIDLGTAIPDCYADAITGNWVVGTCFPPEHQTESRAFAYNLSGGHSQMIDLGTLGGTTAAAFATDGTWAVGYSTTKDGAAHAYAYNLETARPRMIDLGTVGPSPWSRADYVQGGRVLGESPPATFVYDLDAPNATINAIGSLGGAGAGPAAVDEVWVVGSSATADGSQHAFAYNFAAPHPRMIDLGTLGGPQSTRSRGVRWLGRRHRDDSRRSERPVRLRSRQRPPASGRPWRRLGRSDGPGSTRLVAVGDGWIVGGPSVSRGGLVGPRLGGSDPRIVSAACEARPACGRARGGRRPGKAFYVSTVGSRRARSSSAKGLLPQRVRVLSRQPAGVADEAVHGPRQRMRDSTRRHDQRRQQRCQGEASGDEQGDLGSVGRGAPGGGKRRREDGDPQGRAGLPGRRQQGARGALGPGGNRPAGACQRPRHLDQPADNADQEHSSQHADE